MNSASLASSSPAGARGYSLSSDLAKLCLPAEFSDTNRKLAWVNSICFLFLVIGLVGIKPPKIVERPLSEIVEPVAVELPAPQEQPHVQAETPPEETPQVIEEAFEQHVVNVSFPTERRRRDG